MKNNFLILLVVGVVYFGYGEIRGTAPVEGRPFSEVAVSSSSSSFSDPAAFDQRHAGKQVQGKGLVKKILPDDNKGSRHQRFILSLKSGQTILIAHNIDLAPKINGIEVGDSVEFNGVYELNDLGGVVHWTHHDPAGHHENGWLKHRGRTFQ